MKRVQWSAAGSNIFFDVGAEVYAVAWDSSRLWRAAQAGGEAGEWKRAVGYRTYFNIAPDGYHIVYATCEYPGLESTGRTPDIEDYEYEIAISRIDGTDKQRLTANNVPDEYPEWSPDGERIAFLSHYGTISFDQQTERIRLYTMAADGSDVRVIAPDRQPLFLRPVAWSPDGSRIAFVAFAPSRELAIHTVGADGSDYRQVTQGQRVVSSPSWSPDGERIAYAAVDGDEVALYTIAADGSDARRVTTIVGRQDGGRNPASAWIQTLAWSPAGGQILYTCRWSWQVCVVTPDGTRVGESPIEMRDGAVAAWSPDGSRIAVASLSDYKNEVFMYSMAPDGSDLRALALGNGEDGYQALGARQRDGPVDVSGCTAGVAVPDPEVNPGLVEDCESLLETRDVLAGVAELDWNSERPISEWEGVVLGGEPPRVMELTLFQRGLTGVIPPELGELAQLRKLNLGANYYLGGLIPPELGELKQLRVLILAVNFLSGAIPPELGELKQLSSLSLFFNYLQGPIPPELGRLSKLERLELSDNRLTGEIPAELGQLANLMGLYLRSNQLTGEIPVELGQLSKLVGLHLNDNQLTGAIPPEFVQLSNLEQLSLEHNQLTGTIPAELARLPNLKTLKLYSNQLTGCIPGALRRVGGSTPDSLGLPYCE